MLLIGLVGVYFFLPQLVSLHQTFAVLKHTSWWWVILGLLVSVLGVLITVVMQFIAGRGVGTFIGVGILQFGRLFVNSFLPYSLGSIGLAVSYYQRFGKQRT